MDSIDQYTLNASQKQAVETNSGPLLIVAGAGTGKTTTLVEKIKYLVAKKKASPEEILCLTFTDKAAFEMEERVDRAMPYGYFQMSIGTFHSFADEVLRDDLHHIGMNPSYKILSKAQSILFLKKNLFSLNLKYYRPVSNPEKFIEGLLQHFSRLQDEDISPNDYEKWVLSQRHAELDSASKKSGSRIPPIRRAGKSGMTVDELDQLKELSSAYKTYQKIKIENDYMEFGDLIFYLIKLFRTRPNILKSYQKKFKYVLVDEFQDTNIAQYELIKLLCPPKKKPNLTVVGDDSQAIYKFRGASVSNIMQFMSDYKKSKQITLTDNYRSNQTVLDHAYLLIKNNNPDTLEAKLGISKELISHKKNEKNAVQFELFSHGDAEADWIAEKILKLQATSYKLQATSYKFQDIAILVRANSYSDPIIASLRRRGIPYQFLGPGTLFKQSEIKDLIAYLRTLSDPEDSVSFFRVLSMDHFKIDAEDLVILLSFSKRISLSLYQAVVTYLSFYIPDWYKTENENFKQYLPLISKDTREKLIEVIKMLKNHFAKIKTHTAGELLFAFLDDSKLLEKLANPESEAEQKQTTNITKFFHKLKEIENSQEDKSVFAIADFINMSMELGESPLSSESDVVMSDAVNILSVHAGKGLEFPIVFIPDLVNGRFPTYRRREQISIHESLIKEISPSGDYHIQEERRLFYVALTRAMDKVFLTSAEIYGSGVRKRKISQFVLETIGKEAVIAKKIAETDEKEQLSIFDFKKKDEPMITTPEEVKNISYSQLQTYDLCPLQYKYQYILKIPTKPAAAASVGSSVHNALQRFYKAFSEDVNIGLPHLLNLLESTWIPVGFNSKAHQSKMKEEAKQMLANYYHSFHSKEIAIIDLERLFKIKFGSTIYLTGKIDRVDRKENGKIEVIDYKTGRMPDEKKLRKDLQLAIYATAAANPGLYNKPIAKIDLTFYYLLAREKITLKPSEEDVDNVEKTVRSTVAKIRNKEFEPHAGPWCDFCSFRMICEAWQ